MALIEGATTGDRLTIKKSIRVGADGRLIVADAGIIPNLTSFLSRADSYRLQSTLFPLGLVFQEGWGSFDLTWRTYVRVEENKPLTIISAAEEKKRRGLK